MFGNPVLGTYLVIGISCLLIGAFLLALRGYRTRERLEREFWDAFTNRSYPENSVGYFMSDLRSAINRSGVRAGDNWGESVEKTLNDAVLAYHRNFQAINKASGMEIFKRKSVRDQAAEGQEELYSFHDEIRLAYDFLRKAKRYHEETRTRPASRQPI